MNIHSYERTFIKGTFMKDSLQEQLIAARRIQILDAATKVFAEKGFHPTTIKDIAREAGIADGTIYNYFENKTALMLGILDLILENIMGDKTLEAKWDELPDFLTAMILDGLGSDKS